MKKKNHTYLYVYLIAYDISIMSREKGQSKYEKPKIILSLNVSYASLLVYTSLYYIILVYGLRYRW